jgi:Pyruvate/2-oxoacid:ferredoxin oxidoreductase delta subunit
VTELQSAPYKRLAQRLDALPNGYPPTDDGTELRLLAKIFTPEEAALAAQLRLTKESVTQIAERLGGETRTLRKQLKQMVRKGLIAWGRTDKDIVYGLLPFVVGIYEMQVGTIDAELAQLFEEYYQKSFGKSLTVKPQVHRVIPVQESVRMDMKVRPFESAADIVNGAQSWGVLDCLCRIQKELIGDPCHHPKDVCMAMSQQPGQFDNRPGIRSQTRDEALATLERAAEAGLVHSVSNNQEGLWYICNCCTCSCGILRGMSDLGIANVVARSAFVAQVDDSMCVVCEECLPYCQFDALSIDDTLVVSDLRCVGCGLCVQACFDDALTLVRRPEEEILTPPVSESDWQVDRARFMGLDIAEVL